MDRVMRTRHKALIKPIRWKQVVGLCLMVATGSCGDLPLDDNPAALRSATFHATATSGPGQLLMTSRYDFASNGSILRNIVNHGDGTLSVARMAAKLSNTSDRGSYYFHRLARILTPQLGCFHGCRLPLGGMRSSFQ